MVVIFDLDDTLYPEISYVKSSFFPVSSYLSKKYNIPNDYVFNNLMKILIDDGRGKIFDIFLNRHNIFTKKELNKCVSIYRSNIPSIELYEEASYVLNKLSDFPKYLVTDGNKIVQSIKIKALNINKYFKRIFITHHYGIKNKKPSLHCFKIIKKIENCDWNEMIYIGDDPNKDFVNLNKKNVLTIRVKTGRFKNQDAKNGFEAKIILNDLSELISKLKIQI